MRPRASKVAKTRLVETEEDVETYRRLMRCTLLCDTTDGTLDGLVHYQLHLHDGEPAIVGVETVHEDDDLSVLVHWRVSALA